MKVKVLAGATTVVDGEFIAMRVGEVVDVPDARAEQLVEAGIVEAVEDEAKPKRSPRGKRVEGAPENK